MSKLVGVFILGVLAGWLVEWIFVRLFVPNPKKKLESALQSSRKDIQTLQQKNSELQSALSAAQASVATVAAPPVEPAPVEVVVQEAVAEPEPVVVDVVPEELVVAVAEPDGKDDLTRLGGIGPKLAEAMDAAGISRYAQLAALSVEEVNERLAASGIRYSKATAESWAAQAQLAAGGDWEGLKNYQASLKS